MMDWDYEFLGRCQYEDGMYRGHPADCGEPAIAIVTWFDDDGEERGEMYVCAKHLQQIIHTEKEKRRGREPS